MKAFPTILIAAGAAASTLIAAAPADAQSRYRHRDRGLDAGDVITGVAIIGGIAAVASALDRDGGRYGYGSRDRYRGGYDLAVRACGNEAQRYGRGRIQITDVDRTGNDRFRVRGIIAAGYDRFDNGYDRRNDRDYGRYDSDRGDRDGFTCFVRGNGRIEDFRVRDRAQGW
jgi:hypothetical protein